MRKELQIEGCIELQPEADANQVIDEFLQWIESKGWCFGGGFREIRDGHYVLPDGSLGSHVFEE